MNTFVKILMFLLFAALLFYGGVRYGKIEVEPLSAKVEIIRDTVTVEKVAPIVSETTGIKEITVNMRDSIDSEIKIQVDSVNDKSTILLPLKDYVFTGDGYKLVINGYEPVIKSLEFVTVTRKETFIDNQRFALCAFSDLFFYDSVHLLNLGVCLEYEVKNWTLKAGYNLAVNSGKGGWVVGVKYKLWKK